MQRDGATTSLWQNEMPGYTLKNTLAADIVYDVLIVGGGITGIVTGLMLQQAGKNALLQK